MLHKKLALTILFLFLIINNSLHSQTVTIPNSWKFHMGDNMDWTSPSLNDEQWSNKQTGTSWTAPGMKDNVYAWYRIRILIPSTMKGKENGKGIKLNLGKIDDVDQTFFNGKMVGQTGSLPPDYESKWDAERVYVIPEKDIAWDKENVIAVRVFSLDAGGVGMYQGPYSFSPVQWSDSISVQNNIVETDHNGFITKMKFTNNGNYGFNGSVKYWIDDMNGKELFKEKKQVNLKPETGSETEISFSNYQPVNSGKSGGENI